MQIDNYLPLLIGAVVIPFLGWTIHQLTKDGSDAKKLIAEHIRVCNEFPKSLLLDKIDHIKDKQEEMFSRIESILREHSTDIKNLHLSVHALKIKSGLNSNETSSGT